MKAFFVLASLLFVLPLAYADSSNLDAALARARQLRTEGKMGESIALLSEKLQAIAEDPTPGDPKETALAMIEEAKGFSDPARKQARLYLGLEEVKTAMNFKPILEAPLPQGFPPPGEVGKIQVKEYPAYRAARTPMRTMNDDNSAFGKLFRHIQSNQVKMTAPVEMTFSSAAGAESMAFLYESPTIGHPGQQGEVEVVDLPAVTVISIGVRGNYSDERREKAVEQLNGWLKAHADEYETAGSPRLMGYNSPFVLPMLRFAEVQIPIRKKA